MRARNLYFHGTVAASVWRSYRIAKTLDKMWQQDRRAARKILRSCNAEHYFSRFGPLYPDIFIHDMHHTYRGVCLARSFNAAYSFASGWKAFPDHQYGGIYFEASRRFSMNTRNARPFDAINTFVRDSLNLEKKPFYTPGAVLIIDGDYLEEHDLFRPRRGEEAAIAACLPWKAIRGMLFVDRTEEGGTDKVGSFLLGKNISWRDLKPYLTEDDWEYRIMLKKKDARSSSSYEIYRRGYDLPRLRSSQQVD